MNLMAFKSFFNEYKATKTLIHRLEADLDNINITPSYTDAVGGGGISDRTFTEADRRIREQERIEGLELYCKLVEDSLRELEDIERKALYLYHIKGLSMENTGLRLGYSTAKAIIHEAHKKLSIPLEAIYLKSYKTLQ